MIESILIWISCRPIVQEHKKQENNNNDYEIPVAGDSSITSLQASNNRSDPLLLVTDLRESDVPYDMRVAIDLDLRVGAWFTVTPIPVSLQSTCGSDRYILRLIPSEYWLPYHVLRSPSLGRPRLSVSLAKRHVGIMRTQVRTILLYHSHMICE